MKLCKFSFLMMSCVMAAAFVAGCSSSDTAEGTIGRAYDPSQPVKLLSFYPDSGKYLEKVILKGSNLGNDPKAIKVYFNSHKAAVVGSTGENVYVLAHVCRVTPVSSPLLWEKTHWSTPKHSGTISQLPSVLSQAMVIKTRWW